MLTHNGNQTLRDTYCTLIKTFFKFNIKAIAKSPFKQKQSSKVVP